jgi:tetratricopeptide (TPR) repeat protein
MAMVSVNKGEFGQAIDYANRALADNPEATDSKINRGMAYLALKRWREGWRDYDANIGKEKNRVEFIYGDEKRWDGTKGKDIVVYGEQGIGDEISFASCLPDLIKDSKSVTIECDGRLEPLFQRSFPTTKVYGTRYKQTTPRWKEEKPQFDYRVALGQLPGFYRLKDADFKGEPYLTPNPQMALQWRTLLKSLGDKPKIGLAWAGGIAKTGQKRRSVSLDTFGPLFKSFDADWVSLQYKEIDTKDAEDKYGIKIHDWHWGNRIWDYDQSVALISELDLVISVCTTVVHAAGAVGKECWCLVPRVPMWRYLATGSHFPWASSVELFRQKGNEWPVGILLGKLRDKFGDHHLRSEHRKSEEAIKAAA